MVKKKRFKAAKESEEEMAALKKHRAIIDKKEKELHIKHKKIWEEKKNNLKGFRSEQ